MVKRYISYAVLCAALSAISSSFVYQLASSSLVPLALGYLVIPLLAPLIYFTCAFFYMRGVPIKTWGHRFAVFLWIPFFFIIASLVFKVFYQTTIDIFQPGYLQSQLLGFGALFLGTMLAGGRRRVLDDLLQEE